MHKFTFNDNAHSYSFQYSFYSKKMSVNDNMITPNHKVLTTSNPGIWKRKYKHAQSALNRRNEMNI